MWIIFCIDYNIIYFSYENIVDKSYFMNLIKFFSMIFMYLVKRYLYCLVEKCGSIVNLLNS